MGKVRYWDEWQMRSSLALNKSRPSEAKMHLLWREVCKALIGRA
jgi:hypothetical protein